MLIEVEEGLDLTSLLNVQKYEKPVPANLAGTVRGNFPSFIPKTDQERAQNCFGGVKNWIFMGESVRAKVEDEATLTFLEGYDVDLVMAEGTTFFREDGEWSFVTKKLNPPELIEERSGFEATLKLDGSSMTVYYNEGQIGVCSRNLDLKRTEDNLFWKVAIESEILGALAQYGKNIALQGELMGPGVQGNREKLPNHRFFLFDIYDIDQKRYLTRDERAAEVQNLYAIGSFFDVVPEAFENGDELVVEQNDTIHDLLDQFKVVQRAYLGDGDDLSNPIPEGIVLKSLVAGGPSFKVINPTYLLEEPD